jgi:CO/xanthine dehydrogenase FAD-binding subunit
VTPEAIERAAGLAIEAARPIDDQRGSFEFRKHLVRVLTRRTLTTARERANA